ncbi:MAG: hypothetical protein GXO55_09360, partial [Chloroflexi bacterium]|nr:hypothetical protein [Chloroflexota bacterium]
AGDALSDGDTTINDASGDQVARGGVTVYLYDDDGNLVDTTTTQSDGSYQFVVSPGTYWLTIDSKTLTPSHPYNTGFDQGDVWAEQTYGPAGALCADPDDAYGSTSDAGTTYDDPYLRTEPGPCYGGKDGATSDDASSLSTAEHVAKVTVTDQDVTGLDFGFSFNVVTNTNDQDDDPNNDRTAQGSLRQFVQNANAIQTQGADVTTQGANYMRFVPAVSTNASNAGNEWWSVYVQNLDSAVDDELTITDPYTTIDGTAYSYADGTTVRDTNTAEISAPAPVGVSQTTLSPYHGPELEIANANVSSSGFTVDADNVTVRRMAIYHMRNDAAVFVKINRQNVLVEENFLSSRADGSDPGWFNSAKYGIGTESTQDAGAVMDIDAIHNYVAYSSNSGIVYFGAGEIYHNLIAHIGSNEACSDGITIHNATTANIRQNYIYDIAAYAIDGVDAWGSYLIEENTLTLTGQGDRNDTYCPSRDDSPDLNEDELGGVRAGGSDILITKNVIHDTPGHGIVAFGERITISQNAFYDNAGISIDLFKQVLGSSNGDGVTPNDGIEDTSWGNDKQDYPIFTKAVLENGQLTLEGYVGTPSTTTYDGQQMTIEVYKADDDAPTNDGEVIAGDSQSQPHGEGHWYLDTCTVTLGSNGTFACAVAIPDSVSLVPGDFVTAIATDSDGNTSEFGPNKVVHEQSPFAGVVVINEVLYDESGGRSAADNDEFIELYNAGTEAVDLSGWRIGDGDLLAGTQESIDETLSGILNPGAYAVIWVGDPGSGKNAPGASVQIWLGLQTSLNNDGDDIELFDADNRLVDYVAYDRGNAVDPPPIPGIWDDTYQYRSPSTDGTGLNDVANGQSISLTPNGIDADASACWEKTTSGDAQGRCNGALLTVDTDDFDGRTTSVGRYNNGFVISGSLYHDLEPDANRNAGEDWSDGTTAYVKLIQDGSVLRIFQVDPGDGAYAFSAVPPGDYTLIVDDNDDPTDITPTPPSGWIFVSPEEGSRSLTLTDEDVTNQDFALFHGSRITGTVFDDTGYDTDPATSDDGTPNDALQNGDEPGIPDVTVTLSDDQGHTRTTQTDASGHYTLYLPADWGTVTLSHDLRPASGYNHPTDPTDPNSATTVHQAADYEDATAPTPDSSAARVQLSLPNNNS